MNWLGVKEYIKDSIVYIIIFILSLLFVIYVLSFGQISGTSMQNSLYNGDIVVVSKIQYKLISIKRGDIIAFDYKDSKFLVKRIIGLPGERVEIKDNELYIDGKELIEEYIESSKMDDKDYFKVPDDSYFVLGDNREDSLDSRNFGFIIKDDIIGKVLFKIFPFNKIGLVN